MNESASAVSKVEKVFRTGKVDYLSRFPTGECGTIVDITTDAELQGRLMGLGLFVGTRFRLVQGGAASSEPLVLAISETRVALGPDIAGTILVEK